MNQPHWKYSSCLLQTSANWNANALGRPHENLEYQMELKAVFYDRVVSNTLILTFDIHLFLLRTQYCLQ
jgi:hypothetical protein